MELDLDDVASLCRALGQPHRELVILGEGNVSVRSSARTLHVKASGRSMATASAEDFVEVEIEPLLGLLDDPSADDAVVARVFAQSGAGLLVPSIETFLHVVSQTLGDAGVVAHTHPVSVNALLCSDRAEALVDGAVFPDQVVVLGPHPLLVPYADPGLVLARLVRTRLSEHLDRFGEPPKVVYLRNHGLFALGQSLREAENITAMAAKTAKVLLGALSVGSVVYLSSHETERLHSREDEVRRREELVRGLARRGSLDAASEPWPR